MSRYKNPRKDHVYYIEYSLQNLEAIVVKVHIDNKNRYQHTLPRTARYGPFPTLSEARKKGVSLTKDYMDVLKEVIQEIRYEPIEVWNENE